MSNRLIRRIFLLLASLAVATVLDCASVPKFKRTEQIEKSGSVEEALLICGEYRMPLPSARPVQLKPYVECVDDIHDSFETSGVTPFDVFRAELHAKYDLEHEMTWGALQAVELETAIRTMLRGVSRGKSSSELKTRLEKDLALRFFPKTSVAVDAASWPVAKESEPARKDSRLDALRAGVSSLDRSEIEPREEASSHPEQQARLCERVRKLQAETGYLEALFRDQLEMSRLSPDSEISAEAREKYKRRLDQAVHEFEDLRPRLAEARQAGIFRVAACPRN